MFSLIQENFISIFGTIGITYLVVNAYIWARKELLKSKINKLIVQYIPNGIAIGNILKGEKTDSERLFQAVLTVENKVLEVLPKNVRPLADKLIDSKEIAKQIERKLNNDKFEGLAKPTKE